MPISIGSTNVKPYVGNKEVKEAYVGSKLIYKSALPEIVIFDGYTSNVINEIATNENTQYPIKVNFFNNKFYIMNFTRDYSSLIFPTLNHTQIFIDNTGTSSKINIIYLFNDTQLSENNISNNSATFTIPENCNKIRLKGIFTTGGAVVVCKLL